MKVINYKDLPDSRRVKFHAGVSNRILLESDGMGFSLTRTVIQPEAGKVFQHYKNHHESCTCIVGYGVLTCARTGKEYGITPGVTYVLDEHDPHYFQAIEETVLICVFNPPLKGTEVHRADGSYSTDGSN
jgi:L-ectoine synthase